MGGGADNPLTCTIPSLLVKDRYSILSNKLQTLMWGLSKNKISPPLVTRVINCPRPKLHVYHPCTEFNAARLTVMLSEGIGLFYIMKVCASRLCAEYRVQRGVQLIMKEF